jgi:hypothetical protein
MLFTALKSIVSSHNAIISVSLLLSSVWSEGGAEQSGAILFFELLSLEAGSRAIPE